MPVDVHDLLIPSSGQFFRMAVPLQNQKVAAIFDRLVQNATGPIEAREERVQHVDQNRTYWASFLCFQVESPPSFLPYTNLRERSYSFLLLIELQKANQWYLGVFKTRIGSLDDDLEDVCAAIPQKALIRSFGDRATYQKLSSRRMTVSTAELRATSHEAENLETAMPSLGVTRSVPRQLRLRHATEGVVSITPSTSRIHKTGARQAVNGLAALVAEVATETQRARANKFLDAFPIAISFGEKPKGLRPTGILFDWWRLIVDEKLVLKRADPNNGASVPFNPEELQALLGGVLMVRKNGAQWSLHDHLGNLVGHVRENTRGYSVYELAENSIHVESVDTGEMQKLTTWARDNRAFHIALSSPDYFYTGDHLFKRAGFDKEVQLVEGILSALPQLATVDSEKGNPIPHTPAETQFPPHSIFRVVEDVHLQHRDYLWCTDLGDEWADYIALAGSRLILAHCKHGAQSLGATPYQEVVGQALKNVSRIQPTREAYSEKIKAAQNKHTWGHTGIVRLRDAGKNWNDFENAAGEFLKNPAIIREIHLVVSMLSLAEFKAEAVKQKKAPEFIQLVWLLSSFMNSTREMGGRPLVICAP